MLILYKVKYSFVIPRAGAESRILKPGSRAGVYPDEGRGVE